MTEKRNIGATHLAQTKSVCFLFIFRLRFRSANKIVVYNVIDFFRSFFGNGRTLGQVKIAVDSVVARDKRDNKHKPFLIRGLIVNVRNRSAYFFWRSKRLSYERQKFCMVKIKNYRSDKKRKGNAARKCRKNVCWRSADFPPPDGEKNADDKKATLTAKPADKSIIRRILSFFTSASPYISFKTKPLCRQILSFFHRLLQKKAL